MTNTWIHGKVIKVKSNEYTNEVYNVQIKDNLEIRCLPIGTLKLRECLCLKCITCCDVPNEFEYQKIVADE